MKPKTKRPCDVCDGEGFEDDDGHLTDCHLCEGAGYFDENGDPLDEDETDET